MPDAPTYAYVVERADDGSYSAYVPDLPGCTTCGDTVEEVRELIREAAELCVIELREKGEPVPPPSAAVGQVDVAAAA